MTTENKLKALFIISCITLPIWAIPTCIYAMYKIGTGEASIKVSA